MKPRASAAEIKLPETPPTFPGDRRRLSGAVRVEPPGNARASCDSGEATTTQREEPAAASADCSIAETAPFDARAWRSFSAARFTGTVDAIGFSGSRIRQIWFVPAARPAGASPHAVTAPASFKKSLRAMLEATSALIRSRPSILNAISQRRRDVRRRGVLEGEFDCALQNPRVACCCDAAERVG
jgi:hypothetical protein